MPNLLRSIGGTSGRVDAQYDCLDVVILGKFLQILTNLASHNTVFLVGHVACVRVDDVSIGIVDCHLVTFLLLALDVFHVFQRELWETLVSVYLEHLLDFAFHLVGIK